MKSTHLLAWPALMLALCAGPSFAQSLMGEHDMSGKVEKIDHKKGIFQLKTHEGTLRLHFPPATVKDVKNGDELTVHLGFRKGGTPMSMK